MFWVDENGDMWTIVVDDDGRENPTLFKNLENEIDREAAQAWLAANPDVMLSACQSDPTPSDTDQQDVWGYVAGDSDVDVQTWLGAADE
jgi:hypothetical protein